MLWTDGRVRLSISSAKLPEAAASVSRACATFGGILICWSHADTRGYTLVLVAENNQLAR
jgi:hypothetical protein